MKKLLLMFFVLFSTITFGANYYVSNSGNDIADGLTASTSWKTITKVNSSTFAANDSVLFKRGDTFYGAIVANRNNLFFASYGSGPLPIITGLTPLTSWNDDGNGIWRTNISGVKTSLIVVTINGKIQRLGRFPNADASNGGYLTYENISSSIPSITDNQLSGSPDWTGAEIAVRKLHWIIDRCRVTAQNGNMLNYTNPTTPNTYYGKLGGYGYFFQDDIRTLDQFGEWFLNKSTKDLSIYFGTNNPSSNEVKCSTIETLFNCGGGASGYPARSNISVENLAFEGANKQAFFAVDNSNIVVKNCIFNNNYSGIFMTNVANSLSDRNVITNTLNNGIEQLGRSSSPTVIQYNTIRNCGMFAGMGQSGDGTYCALRQDGNSSTIEFNRVDSIGYLGIEFTGSNVNIRYNYVTNFCMTKDDGGGIYTWSNNGNSYYTNRVISYNTVIGAIGARLGTPGTTKDAQSIYLDGGAMNVNVLNNTVSQAVGAGIFLNNTINVQIKNNTIYNVPTSISMQRFADTQLLRNVSISNNISYPTATNIFYWNAELNIPTTVTIQDDMKAIGTFDNNYYRNNTPTPFDYFYHLTNGGTFVDPPALNFTQWQTFIGKEANSQVLSTEANIFQYNPTSGSVEYKFSGLSKKDAYGSIYDNSYTIPAFSSVILFDNGLASVTSTPPIIGAITQPTCAIPAGSVVLNGLPETGIWTLTRTPGGATMTGTGTNTTISGLVTGAYTFSVTNASGSVSASSANVVINSIPPLAKPIITQNGNVLHSDAINYNQWYNQIGSINGATNQDFTAVSNQDYYYVIVAVGNCISEPSNTIQVVITGIENAEKDKKFIIYPNPVLNELNIELKGNTKNTYFEILNSIGQTVFTGNLDEKTIVQTSGFSRGFYFLKLESDKAFEFKKFIKE